MLMRVWVDATSSSLLSIWKGEGVEGGRGVERGGGVERGRGLRGEGG